MVRLYFRYDGGFDREVSAPSARRTTVIVDVPHYKPHNFRKSRMRRIRRKMRTPKALVDVKLIALRAIIGTQTFDLKCKSIFPLQILRVFFVRSVFGRRLHPLSQFPRNRVVCGQRNVFVRFPRSKSFGHLLTRGFRCICSFFAVNSDTYVPLGSRATEAHLSSRTS